MESAILLTFVLSVLVGFGIRGRISKRLGGYLTAVSLLGVLIGAGGYLTLTELLVGTPVPNRELITLIFIVVFLFSLWVFPVGVISLTGAKRETTDQDNK